MQKTPDKVKENVRPSGEITPEKLSGLEEPETSDLRDNAVSLKEVIIKTEVEFKTPEKIKRSDLVDSSAESNSSKNITPEKSRKSDLDDSGENSPNNNKTPEKNVVLDQSDLKSEQISCDGEDGMISTAEQARLLIAANKTPSKCINKTPVKQSTPSGKRSVENSPVTPGKYKRVNLITLASPKAKRIKQI